MRNKINIILNGLFIFLILLAVSSCLNKGETYPINVIPVGSSIGTYNLLNLSDYATDIKYIPLETSDSVLVGVIPQICYEDEKILIKDISSLKYNCYLFDNQGKFCRKIGQWGQGPNDYLYILTTFIYENLIFLQDVNKFLIYDISGNLVGKYNFLANDIIFGDRAFYIHEILPLKKDTFIMNITSWNTHYPKAIVFETDNSDIKIIKEYPNYVKIDKLKGGFSSEEAGVMYRFKDDVRKYSFINDTVFTIGKDMEINNVFIFELEKYKPPASLVEITEENVTLRKKYIFPTAICESQNHLFIKFSFGDHAHEPFEYMNNRGNKSTNRDVYGIFDKRTGSLSLMKQPIKGKLGFKNDIDNGPIIWPHYISSNNELVTYIYVEEFMEYYKKIENPTLQMREVAENVKLDDNQIVIIAKLKE